MKRTFPWLAYCVKEFDITNIGETYSMASLIQNKSMEIKPMSKHKKPSILSALAQAKEKANALNTNRPIKPKSKNKEIER